MLKLKAQQFNISVKTVCSMDLQALLYCSIMIYFWCNILLQYQRCILKKAFVDVVNCCDIYHTYISHGRFIEQ